MNNIKISASLENYLEAILEIYKEKNIIRAIDVSKKLNVTKSSVTDAFRLLSNKNLIIYQPYEPIVFTEKGKALAEKVTLKHNILFRFLNEVLCVEKNEAIKNACEIEHVISENILDRLISFLEFYENSDCLKNGLPQELNKSKSGKLKKKN